MGWYRAVRLLLFAIVVGFAAVIFIGVPLLPEQNDSAWYYVNVHYLLTGRYIWESMYPSFTGPCQYYPMGYSLVRRSTRPSAELPRGPSGAGRVLRRAGTS